MRAFPILAGVLLLALPALAGDSGRYAIEPAGEGFVRLDTATGAASHCTKTDGVWRCAAVPDERRTLEQRIAALTDEVASLRAELTRVKDELGRTRAALADAEAALAASAPAPVAAEPTSFTAALMQRFVKMVRVLKGLEAPPSA
jgi:septal ring factor EnvC (AmiA/AmiB activator)